MSKGTFVKLLIACLVSALGFSVLSLLFLNRYSEMSWRHLRQEFSFFLADNLERKIQPLSLAEIKLLKAESIFPRDFRRHPPPPPMDDRDGHSPPAMMPPPPDDFSMHRPPPLMMGDDHLPPPPGEEPPGGFPPGGPRGMHHPPMGPGGPGGPGGLPPFASNRWWLINENNEVILANSEDTLPTLPAKPEKIHESGESSDFFRLFPSVYITKLDKQPVLYLVTSDNRKPFSTPLLLVQAIFTFGTIAAALGFSLSLMFWYLRRKSEEARGVLLKLGRGDLKARFNLQRIDEVGGLMLDFNRMADEIEKLVMRIHSVESTRKNLLQELGHDLRTPLTSLKTSVETLSQHFDKMSGEDRDDLVNLINGEVDYFKDLIEKLMTIASLDEPQYKKTAEPIDLFALIDKEIRSRQMTAQKIQWSVDVPDGDLQRYVALGDAHLILRMLRNAMDNAGRFANSKIKISFQRNDMGLKISVCDDGTGFTPEGLEGFGKRREFRGRSVGADKHFSLGLGSIIMKTIAELHGGQVQVENIWAENTIVGAAVIFQLPPLEQT